jgi:pimeloyl-ACP methyl ester carboxylesterase
MDTARLHRAVSADGTQIVGSVHGQGPPIALVPGGPADGESGWLSLLPHLTDHFTCFPINTRGRALSADHPDHSRERLVEDIVAFVESIGDAVVLFGHSAGGTHALEAAAHTSAVRDLVLYEPTLMELASDARLTRFADAFARVRRATEEGRPADGAWIFLEELAMANERELTLLAEADAAQAMAPLVPVVLAEEAQSGLPQLSDLSLLDRVTMPVLLLHGARTDPFFTGVVEYLAERLADCRVREVPEVGHLGPEVAPEPVAADLVGLLEATAPQPG